MCHNPRTAKEQGSSLMLQLRPKAAKQIHIKKKKKRIKSGEGCSRGDRWGRRKWADSGSGFWRVQGGGHWGLSSTALTEMVPAPGQQPEDESKLVSKCNQISPVWGLQFFCPLSLSTLCNLFYSESLLYHVIHIHHNQNYKAYLNF